MTFQLNKFQAYGIEPSEPVTKRWRQFAILTIAAANTDTALDIGTNAGTFWTAAIADTTYGATVATPALAALKDIQLRAESFTDVESSELLSRGNANSPPNITQLTSAAYAGGSATPTLTVTGLLTTDVILAATQQIANGNSLPLLAYGTPGSGTLAVTYSADPGASGKVRVAILRTAAAASVAGQYSVAIANLRPNITWVSGDAPTAYDIVMSWTLNPAQEPIELYVP